MTPIHYDVIVIGSGPAGQKAAVQAAKAGKRAVIIERERTVGGACVFRGTIPSKTLRESALRAQTLKSSADLFDGKLRDEIELGPLMSRLDAVVSAHSGYMANQLERNGIKRLHGRARFVSTNQIDVEALGGKLTRLEGSAIIIASGSRPRLPPGMPIDHENILDSDSILSLAWLPQSLVVLGAGVIACEYASVFAHLGTKVTIIDSGDRPLRFLDAELTAQFVAALERTGGRFLGGRGVETVRWDEVSQVVTTSKSGEQIRSDKVLVTLGRVANVEGLGLEAAGLRVNARGLLDVNEHCQTAVPHIYGVGDVIGPPALATTAMEQGRRAVRHALGLPAGGSADSIPVGVYTIPEMASVGLDEEAAKKLHGSCLVGRARFDEVARGQISGLQGGLLKLIADPTGQRVLGVQIVGEGATELVHLGQMALISGMSIDGFIDTVFNFPTLAEAYRVAALHIASQRE